MTVAHGGKAVYGASVGMLLLETRFPRIPGDVCWFQAGLRPRRFGGRAADIGQGQSGETAPGAGAGRYITGSMP